MSLENFTAAAQGDEAHMLGKLLYFSLSNLLVEKKKLSELCESMGIVYAGGTRLAVADAFRSATGDIKDRVVTSATGDTRILHIYCRDNKRSTRSVLSRELVKETMNQETNQYEKLANISFDKDDQVFSYDNLAYDPDVDAAGYCHQAQRLFELYQRCANRKQIETICLGFLRSLEATKLSVNGHLYFVPRHTMDKVSVFEDFISELSALSQIPAALTANSIYIIDDEKQRGKMTEEFYNAVKKEIAECQERCDYFIKSGSQSPSVMDRWVLKVRALKEKKLHYEEVLRHELDGLDDEFATLEFLSQELQVRAQTIRFQKAA